REIAGSHGLGGGIQPTADGGAVGGLHGIGDALDQALIRLSRRVSTAAGVEDGGAHVGPHAGLEPAAAGEARARPGIGLAAAAPHAPAAAFGAPAGAALAAHFAALAAG